MTFIKPAPCGDTKIPCVANSCSCSFNVPGTSFTTLHTARLTARSALPTNTRDKSIRVAQVVRLCDVEQLLLVQNRAAVRIGAEPKQHFPWWLRRHPHSHMRINVLSKPPSRFHVRHLHGEGKRVDAHPSRVQKRHTTAANAPIARMFREHNRLSGDQRFDHSPSSEHTRETTDGEAPGLEHEARLVTKLKSTTTASYEGHDLHFPVCMPIIFVHVGIQDGVFIEWGQWRLKPAALIHHSSTIHGCHSRGGVPGV
jgi:hypothetical protein